MANLKELIVNGVSHFIGKVFINDSHITTINGVEVTENPKFTDTVTTVAYDSTNKKITKTVDGTTSDVVTAATLKTAMGLDNVEANQNAFSNVKIGAITFSADAKTDTLELVAGSNITLTPDTTNDKVTIAMTSNMVIQNIASNANLNTITTDGWYMVSTDAIASSLSNCPSTKSFLMEVYHINSATGSNEVIYQKISTSENVHYERVKSGGAWSEWKSSCHIDLNGVVYI